MLLIGMVVVLCLVGLVSFLDQDGKLHANPGILARCIGFSVLAMFMCLYSLLHQSKEIGREAVFERLTWQDMQAFTMMSASGEMVAPAAIVALFAAAAGGVWTFGILCMLLRPTSKTA